MDNHTHTATELITSPKVLAIPVGIQGITLIGVTLSDWVLIMTLLLLTTQLVAWAFRGIRLLNQYFKE